MKIIKPIYALLALSCAYGISLPVWAFSALNDEDMGLVAGQSGLTFNVSSSSGVTASQIAWRDRGAVAASERQLQLRDISLAGLDATLKVDVGSSSADIAALAVNALIKPFLLQVGSFCPAASGSVTACASSFGAMALRTNNNTSLNYYNTRGILDGTGGASPGAGQLTFDLSNAEFYMAQSKNSQRDLTIINNLYFKGTATGSFFADTNGLRMKGSVSLPRISAGISGLNMDLSVNPAVATGFTTVGSTPLLHFGASGLFSNVDWLLTGGGSNSVITGAVAADSGLMMSLSAELKSGLPAANGFEFEIGEGDASGYSVRFTNFVSFLNGNNASPSNGIANFGKLYVNVLPEFAGMADFRTGFGSLSNQPANTLAVAVRDLELQAYPRNVVLYKYSDSSTISMNPSGTLMLPLYDLDANLLLMPEGHAALADASRRGIGFNLKAAMTGTNAVDATGGDKITGLLLADTSASVGRYIGIRNLNGYITWQQGQLYAMDPATDGATGLRLTSANNVQINLDGQFALDYLPDGTAARKIKTTGHLFGLAVQLQSAGTTLSVMPSPAGQSYLAITGSLNLQAGTNSGLGACSGGAAGTGSCVSITEPVDGSQVQLASISGKINLTDSRIEINKETAASSGLGGTMARGYVSFANTVQFDPGLASTDVVRVGNINFLGGGSAASPTPTAAYRLGEVVVPGGELYTRFDLRQR